MPVSTSILLTITLGFAPPLFWLWFWLKEDVHPEPRKEIMLVFLIGMAAVILAFILQTLTAWRIYVMQSGPISFFDFQEGLSKNTLPIQHGQYFIIGIILFAFFEEISKWLAAFVSGLRSRYFNEPIDAMIYVLTASLGFAAFENALFVSNSLANASLKETLVISSFRFANAVLIHGATGAVIGASFAFSFCHHRRRIAEFLIALFAATALHATYNYYILEAGRDHSYQLYAIITVGITAAIALILFERAKRLKAICEPE